MKKSQFIFVLMLSTSFATMARADDTSLANCVAAVGVDNVDKCVKIGSSDTYYALSGDEGNKTMTIYGTKGSESNAATVPNYAFYNNRYLESTFPGDVTSLKTSGNVDIGKKAFAEATGLTGHLDLSGVQTIGEQAFQGATGLTSVDLTGVQTIGTAAFNGATGLTGDLDLSGVQTIGTAAFQGATGLTSVNLSGVQTIGSSTFNGATGLTGHLDLTGVQTIGFRAFGRATGLTSVDLTGVQTIGFNAFERATGLKRIVISDSLLDSNGNILEYSCDVNNVCAGIYSSAFEGSGLNTIYCPKGKTCGNSFTGLSDTPTIISYSKNEGETYSVGENMYANADMMTKNIACENADQCAALQTAFNAGNTCVTQDACNTLALQYGAPSEPSTPSVAEREPKRIYTIDEATKLSKKTGNTFRLRYK